MAATVIGVREVRAQISGSRPSARRRFLRHVTRSRARGAVVLVLLCAMGYALLQLSSLPNGVEDPLRQVALILGGVAASAIFLPELSSNLWTLSKDQVRGLVPDDRREALVKSLIGADSDDPEWDDLVYDQVVHPLLDAGRRRDQTIKNMNYTVHVHLDQQAVFGDQVVRIHNVETVSTSERQLPTIPTTGFWISAARTDAALRDEFGRPGCLARELVDLRDTGGVPLEGQRWLDAVQELCRVVITINGQVQEMQFVADEATDIVRWRFHPEAAETEQRVPVQVAFDFPVSASMDRFPVMFSSYYCAGSTVVSLKLYGLPADQQIRCDPFFARGLGPQSGTGELVRAQGALSQQVSFSTGRNSLLWPGSGVLFDWHSC